VKQTNKRSKISIQDPSASTITSKLDEKKSYGPPKAFQKLAHLNSEAQFKKLYNESIKRPESFWKKMAQENLFWHRPFKKVLSGQSPHFRWFEGGQINASENCLESNIKKGLGNKAALIWEGEPGEQQTLTYQQLLNKVNQLANTLVNFGIQSGDRVTIYMPLIPEAIIAMQACARIGAMHNVVFAGFSADALADRNNDAQAKFLITADGGFRKGQPIALKSQVDEALKKSPSVENVLVFKRTGQNVSMKPQRDYWWHETVDKASHHHTLKHFDSENPLFLLYTSGSTGKPKGILHTTAGYLLQTKLSSHYIFDLKSSDIYWCSADVGWVTGHTYVAYGPLSCGATVFLYEGAPNFPDWSRFWRMIDRHKITIFYTAPTAIRAFIKSGIEWVKPHDLTSLRLLGSVGEPINPEAWRWYHKEIGNAKCPIIDTWWQTETGSAMITPIPGLTKTKPGSATKPFFGVEPAIVTKEGQPVPKGSGGFLVIKKPWPSMLRTIFNDDARYVQQYWSQIPGCYFTGDGARCDKDGYYWILGRIDDVLNVSGHRLSTMEIESSLVSFPDVAEAAVVGRPDDLKGEAIVAFVSLKAGTTLRESLKDEIKQHVVKHIGALARPDDIRFADALPKTRSGKIMRRLLRELASGRSSNQDTSTLEDISVLATLRDEQD
jgi:acetyl-CoA synthetase